MNPNFAFNNRTSGGHISDVWPKSHDLSQDVVDAFVTLSRGWLPDAGNVNLAIRRLAASFSRSGGQFGMEDRILDVAIALEVCYGGKTGNESCGAPQDSLERPPLTKSKHSTKRRASIASGMGSCTRTNRGLNTMFSKGSSRRDAI